MYDNLLCFLRFLFLQITSYTYLQALEVAKLQLLSIPARLMVSQKFFCLLLEWPLINSKDPCGYKMGLANTNWQTPLRRLQKTGWDCSTSITQISSSLHLTECITGETEISNCSNYHSAKNKTNMKWAELSAIWRIWWHTICRNLSGFQFFVVRNWESESSLVWKWWRLYERRKR